MKFIVRLFPEITIKSKPVRKRMVKQLRANIRKVMQRIDENVEVTGIWDAITVESTSKETPELLESLRSALARIPGIVHFNEVKQYELGDMHDVYEKTLLWHKETVTGKTFRTKVKRVGNHDFTSIDVERYVGGGLNQNCDTNGVSLKNPEVVVQLEIKDDILYVVLERTEGLGGFPLGCQDTVVTLISGGFDSGVAAYQVMKRGLRSHFVFFNLGGKQHEIGVKQVSKYIWDQYGSSHNVKFVAVPFEPVVEEILTKVENSQMGVILKRMMMRAADKVAEQYEVSTLVTGEAVAQVSSQTLPNLNIIDKVCDRLVLRPLIVTDKQDIIDTARKIGTASFAETMPEYCGVISKKPTTHAKMPKILAEEERFDFAVLDQAVEDAKHYNIADLTDFDEDQPQVDEFTLSNIPEGAVVVDVRHPEETDEKPLVVEGVTVEEIPFYSLKRTFLTLDKDVTYALYCDKGVMSKLHAMYLADEGHNNVALVKVK